MPFFLTETTDNFEHVIRLKSLKMASQKEVAVRGIPKKNQQYWALILSCLWNVSHRLVSNFARQAAPPNIKLWKTQVTEFKLIDEDELAIMNALKTALIPSTPLYLPNAIEPMTFDTDTRDNHIGCALLQMQEDRATNSMNYWSRTLNDSEKRMTPRKGND